MSAQTLDWVFEHSTARGAARLVLLSLADDVPTGGTTTQPVRRIAGRCRLSERAVQGALKALVDLGELEVEWQAGPRGTNRYRIRVVA